MGVMEEVADAAARAFGDLARAFGRADTGIFGSNAYAFAKVVNTLDGMEGDEVSCAFCGAFGYIARRAACAFADVAGTAADVAAGTAGWCWLGLGRRGWWRGGLLLSVSSCGRE